jgi:glycosyltransferase involved in cell wall biosynthesis
MRLHGLGREFGLDLSQCELTTYDRFAGGPRPDCMFTLGNHVVPPVPAHAANGWYLCQFPFPIDPAELQRCRSFLDGYRGIIVYSDYARTNIARALNAAGLRPPPVEIVHPPVPAFAGDAGRKKMIILTVGRFFLGKRKDLMISAFRALIEKFGGELELHLAGSSIPHPLHMAHLADLQNMAGDLPVKFHVNPTSAVLAMLYRDAAIYWHANGLQADLERGPEKAEHFGISIVEAMSAQCVPLAFNAGGPREIITHGADGFLYETTDSLVELTLDLLRDNGAGRRVVMGRAAGKTAERYTVERFIARMRQLVDAAGAASASGC